METYVIHNVVRRRGTRLQRKQAAGRHRFVQKIGGGVLTVRRKRGKPVSKTLLEQHLVEIKQKIKAGMLEVRTPGGQLVDLNTMKAAPPPAPKKEVEPKKAEFKQPTTSVPAYPEGKGITDEVEAPEITLTDLPEGFEPEPSSPELTSPDKGTATRKNRAKKGSKK